jgi:hypothetical protein
MRPPWIWYLKLLTRMHVDTREMTVKFIERYLQYDDCALVSGALWDIADSLMAQEIALVD